MDSSLLQAFYGLSGYPADLVGLAGSALVGGVATGGSTKAASRSAIAARRKLARELALENVDEPWKQDFAPRVETDPLATPALRQRLENLDDFAVARVVEAGLAAAFDWTDEASSADALHAALIAWGRLHNVDVGVSESEAPYRQEHRNSANAVMSICLWQIVSHDELLQGVLNGSHIAAWLQLPDVSPSLPLTTGLSDGSVVDLSMNAAELIRLVDDVHHLRDPSSGRAAIAVEMFRTGRAEALLGAEEGAVIWMLGYGLGASDSWQIVELARWYARERERDWRTISLISWSAHVASMHLHDSLAWRLTSLAQRWALDLVDHDQQRLALMTFNSELIRSGCRVREADRLCELEPAQASRRLNEAKHHLGLARDALLNATNNEADVEVSLPLGLRRIEVVLVSAVLHEFSRSELLERAR